MDMAKSNVTIKGIDSTLKNLEKTLGDKKVRSISRKAINKAGGEVKGDLKEDMKAFRDTGASINEVVQQNATKKATGVSGRIGWNGPQNRYKLIHLNEWGYTRFGKQYRPRGFGVIEKSLKGSEKKYLETIESELRNNL
ncbi:hypothetical protein TEHN7125_2273 [Tetragenococcus halophilus subsp. halophilus]|nr:hypothetical protein TEHN7125_2273 [Tetragenococcus halophilus subsp. halophilus]